MPHRMRPHLRPADADVDDIRNFAFAANPIREGKHAFTLRVYFFVVRRGSIKRTQRRMQCRAVFRQIDDFAGTHPAKRTLQIDFFRIVNEIIEIRLRQALSGQIQRNAAGGNGSTSSGLLKERLVHGLLLFVIECSDLGRYGAFRQ